MKKFNIKILKAGIFTLLPVVLFIYIIKWIVNSILKISDNIFFFIPNEFYINQVTGNILWYWHVIGIIILILLIACVGWIMSHYYIGRKIKSLIQPIIKRTPILKTLIRLTNQISEISQNKNSFKEVVFVEFPRKGIFSIGFITSDNIKTIEEKIGKKAYSVFIPTTPNPTNGYICIIPEDEIIKTKLSITEGLEYVVYYRNMFIGHTNKTIQRDILFIFLYIYRKIFFT